MVGKYKRLAIATYVGCGHQIEVEVSDMHVGDVVRQGHCPTCKPKPPKAKVGDIISCKYCGNPRRVGGPRPDDVGWLQAIHHCLGCGLMLPEKTRREMKELLWKKSQEEDRKKRGKRLAKARYIGCGHKVEIEVSIRHVGDVDRHGSCPTCNTCFNLFGGIGDANDEDYENE